MENSSTMENKRRERNREWKEKEKDREREITSCCFDDESCRGGKSMMIVGSDLNQVMSVGIQVLKKSHKNKVKNK